MTTEFIISEEFANKVCAILVNHGENRIANKLCSRPAPQPDAPDTDEDMVTMPRWVFRLLTKKSERVCMYKLPEKTVEEIISELREQSQQQRGN